MPGCRNDILGMLLVIVFAGALTLSGCAAASGGNVDNGAGELGEDVRGASDEEFIAMMRQEGVLPSDSADDAKFFSAGKPDNEEGAGTDGDGATEDYIPIGSAGFAFFDDTALEFTIVPELHTKMLSGDFMERSKSAGGASIAYGYMVDGAYSISLYEYRSGSGDTGELLDNLLGHYREHYGEKGNGSASLVDLEVAGQEVHALKMDNGEDPQAANRFSYAFFLRGNDSLDYFVTVNLNDDSQLERALKTISRKEQPADA